MFAIVRSFLVVSALALGLGLFAPASRAADAPKLIDQQAIELDGFRIIAISPDGTKIAAATAKVSELCIFETASLAQQVCADLSPLEAGLRIGDVSWSPDSTKLALTEQSFIRLIDGDLWVMDAATGALTDLTDDGVNAGIPFGDAKVDFHVVDEDNSPTWLPDSSGSPSLARRGKTASGSTTRS